MFTGLIEQIGKIEKVLETAEGRRFQIAYDGAKMPLAIGDSIAVNGVCQTVEEFTSNNFTVYSIPDTLEKTNLSELVVGDLVNLETALTLEKKIGGHIVQGHVEGTAEVFELRRSSEKIDVIFHYHSPYIIPEGSICLNGISLTIQEVVGRNVYRVQIIPETINKTNVGTWKEGDKINIETDYLIKAADHIRSYREASL